MTGEGPVDPVVRDAIAELWQEAHGVALSRVAAVEAYLAGALTGNPGEEELVLARRCAHQMAGTLGTFGLSHGSWIGSELEAAMEDGHPPADQVVALAELTVELRELIEAATPARRADTSPPATPSGTEVDTPSVAVVGPDRSFIEATTFELRRRGVAVRRAVHGPVGPVDLAVVDLGPDGRSMAEVAELAGAGALVAVTGVPLEVSLRLELLGAGAVALFDPGADPAEVADLVGRLADLRRHAPRVGVLEDHHEAAAVLSRGLGELGIDVELLDGPSALLDPSTLLDAVVIGSSMSARRAGELVRLFRGDHRRWDCPVMVLAGPAPELVAAGADEVMEATEDVAALARRLWGLLVRRALRPVPGGLTWQAPVVRTEDAESLLRREDDLVHREPGPGGTVLVVEDDPTMAALLERVLTSHGWSVRMLGDGVRAAEVLADHGSAGMFDLILLDISLPGLDGFGVLGRMQEAGTLQALPVVVLTARSRDEEVVRALEMGASDHVAKPVSVDVLLHRLDRVLQRIPA